MASVQARVRWSPEQLLAAVKDLPPAELREFQRQFAEWRGQDNQAEADDNGDLDEEALLTCIRENSALPAREQRRFDRLRRKRQNEALTEAEQQDLQALWQRVEQMNVTRLQALTELARQRGTTVKTVMRQLGLGENHDAR